MLRFCFLSIAFAMVANSSHALTSGPFSPSSASQSGGTLSWNNPSRALSSNNQYAAASGGISGGTTATLHVSNFSMNIPSNAEIEGITVQIERRRGSINNVSDTDLRLFNGSSVGADLASPFNWPTSDAYATYGGTNNLWGFGSLTPAQLNSSSFRVDLQAFVSPNTSASVDHVRIYVHYSLHLPFVTNVVVSPANPFSADDLTLTYTYNDDEGHTEDITQIRWYRDDILQPAFNNLLTVGNAFTLKGEKWQVIVQPHDGTVFGGPVASVARTIANSIPFANAPTLDPEFPTTEDPLITTHFYFDADGDTEQTPVVRWYKDGAVQNTYDDLTTLPSAATTKGETWHYTLRPNDGDDVGALITSTTRTILNTAPQATDLTMFPANPVTLDTLSVSWTYDDPDGDPSVGTQLKWFLNGVHQPQYDGNLFISSGDTWKGQQWHFTILPNDGVETGSLETSSVTTVKNSLPYIQGLNFILANRVELPSPKTDLILSYDYDDFDNDVESGTTIRWHRNDVLQSSYNDDLTIVGVPLDGSNWYAEVRPHDGQTFGFKQTTLRKSTAPNLPAASWPAWILTVGAIAATGIYRRIRTR